MEAARSSKMFVSYGNTARHQNPEDFSLKFHGQSLLFFPLLSSLLLLDNLNTRAINCCGNATRHGVT